VSTLSETLTRLAQSMESLRTAGSDPAWAEIVGPFEHPEGVHWHRDLETMVGFVAPPGCNAIATVGYGWARGIEDGGPPPPVEILAPGERRRVRIVCLMTRTGDMAGYLRDGPTVLLNEPPTVGRVVDCMRRCFLLPTPAPEEPTDLLLADLWLSNVLGAAQRAPQPLTWQAVGRLHPVIQVVTEHGIEVGPLKLPSIIRIGADSWPWSYLVAQAAEPGWLNQFLPAGAGGWMDEGILSRWLLDSVTRADRLLDQVVPLVQPTAAKRLRATLKQLGVLDPRPSRLNAGADSATGPR
jgi:hypothetical protein